MKNKLVSDEDWIESIKSSMTNNSKPYTTVTWMQIETGKPTKTVRHELEKRVKSGLLVKITVNNSIVWYKISARVINNTSINEAE